MLTSQKSEHYRMIALQCQNQNTWKFYTPEFLYPEK